MPAQRKFIPGEEWAFIKIYGGPKILDELLTNEILVIVSDCHRKLLIDNFFFVRFADSKGYHLRLRFHLSDLAHFPTVVTMLSGSLKQYIDHRMIFCMTLDTYSRELERYGSNSIQYAESIFHASSLQIMGILQYTPDYTQRWLLAIKNIDHLLGVFGLQPINRYQLYQSYFTEYATEFGLSKGHKEVLKVKTREYLRDIDKMINSELGNSAFIPEFSPIIDKCLMTSSAALLRLDEQGQLHVSIESLLKSFMHMHYNRIFRIRQRFHEFVLYHILSKYYQSVIARHKYEINADRQISIS